MSLGAGHTSGDIVAWVPDAEVMFLRRPHRISFGVLLRRRAFAGMAGDAERNPRLQSEGDRAGTRRRLERPAMVRDAIAMTRDFVSNVVWRRRNIGRQGRNLKETMAAAREVMDPKFSSFAIYEHCLPFNVSRAFDEASGSTTP